MSRTVFRSISVLDAPAGQSGGATFTISNTSDPLISLVPGFREPFDASNSIDREVAVAVNWSVGIRPINSTPLP